jgi:hypothetical protein
MKTTAPIEDFNRHPDGKAIFDTMYDVFSKLMDELQYRSFVQPLCGWDDDGISISWLRKDTGGNPYQIRISDTTIKLRVLDSIRRANGTKDSICITLSAPYDAEEIAGRLYTEVIKVNGRLNV